MSGMRGWAAGLAFTILAGTVFGTLLLIWGGVFLWGESTRGRVVALHHAGTGKERGCQAEIEYTAAGKSRRLVSAVKSSPCGWSEGELVTVFYSPRAPNDGYLATVSGLLPFGLAVALGCVLLGFAVRAFRARAADAPPDLPPAATFELGEAPEGELVGIRGTVTATGSTVPAPMSGRDAVAWQIEVRRPVYGEEGELVHRAVHVEPFSLRDARGTVVELTPQLRLDTRFVPTREGDTEREPSEKLTALLSAAGFDPLDARTTDNHYLWSEAILASGDTAVIFGILRPDRGASSEAGYRGGPRRLAIEAPEDGEVIITSG